MNPNIQHDLMRARIAEIHRCARRADAGRTARTALTRARWSVIVLMAAAVTFLSGVPAAHAMNVPPPGEDSGASAPVVIHPAAVGGMAGWQIVLIAVGSALLASALTLLAVWVGRRATPAQPTHP
jgi:hypothetical protein